MSHFHEHYTDADGNPEGGVSYGPGYTISYQRGPLGRIGTPERKEPNGAFVEDILHAACNRLHFYQTASGGRFACSENAYAIKHIGEAITALNNRTTRRIQAGTEGTTEGN